MEKVSGSVNLHICSPPTFNVSYVCEAIACLFLFVVVVDKLTGFPRCIYHWKDQLDCYIEQLDKLKLSAPENSISHFSLNPN